MIGRIALAGGIAAAAAAGVGWAIARRLTAPISPRTFDLTNRSVEHDNNGDLIVLDRTEQTTEPGIYNLWFETGGWAQLSTELVDRGHTRVARRIAATAPGLVPKAGERASWSGICYATPADAGIHARGITITTPAGACPPWRIDGAPSTWAIHVHGLRQHPRRHAPRRPGRNRTRLHLPGRQLPQHCRRAASRHRGSTLGDTETPDVDEAIGYAVRRGAQRIALFGWSMGAAIALQLADHPRNQGLISALVLDSPVLNWAEVIKSNCARSGLPAAAGHLAIPWLTLTPLARAIGLPGHIPLRSFDWTARAADITTPTLILHGTRDDSVPVRLSHALRVARPELVELETFDAGHTLCWNTDPDRWQDAVATWLAAPGEHDQLTRQR